MKERKKEKGEIKKKDNGRHWKRVLTFFVESSNDGFDEKVLRRNVGFCRRRRCRRSDHFHRFLFNFCRHQNKSIEIISLGLNFYFLVFQHKYDDEIFNCVLLIILHLFTSKLFILSMIQYVERRIQNHFSVLLKNFCLCF